MDDFTHGQLLAFTFDYQLGFKDRVSMTNHLDQSPRDAMRLLRLMGCR